MSWKKHFKVANPADGSMSPISGSTAQSRNYGADFGFRNYASRLPEVYSGHPNRIERYNQYEAMDTDAQINACLDIISEFSTQKNLQNGTSFNVKYKEKATDHEIKIIKEQLQAWVKLNKFDQRMFKMFRNVIKYGDQVFIRDPQTFELYYVDMTKVSRVIVNESEGKRPEQYIVRDINPNFQNLTISAIATDAAYANQPQQGSWGGQPGYTVPSNPFNQGSRFSLSQNESAIAAEHVVHLSLSEGLDFYWPFGQSILESIFKVYKQKELLEDSILIYRVQRAPERRVFYIDVGNMPSHLAMQFVERVKNEIHQRRIPTLTGGSMNILDATYNPLSINEDYFFPQTAEGRGSRVEMLQGGQAVGEIDDLKYFNNMMMRGLRVPSSYLPTGPDDSTTPLSDGRVGTALIQEFRFNEYCKRLQQLILHKLDDEFKMFMRWRGFNIDSSLFDLEFNPPQNFAAYREAELDTSRVSTFTTLEPLPYMSKRFLLKRYLGLSEEEVLENEEMWREERDEPAAQGSQGSELRSVGISPGGFEADLAGLPPEGAAAGELGGADLGAPGAAASPAASTTTAPGAPPAV
jgi:hypothetical protein